MLCAHSDVVPAAGQSWDYDPFVLHEKDGKLFGRGSADMKGFIAASCYALEKLDHKKLKKPLSLLFTYDEEIGCEGSKIAAPRLKNYLGYMPEAALIGEPTDFSIFRMHSGHVSLKIHAHGKAAHSSNPDLGRSAIKALHKVLESLFELEEKLKKNISMKEYFSLPYVTLNVGCIKAGTAVNIIPERGEILIGFRPLPDTVINNIINNIKYILDTKSKETKVLLNLSIENITPAMISQADTKLERIIKPYANKNNSVAASFSTDAGNLSEAGISCLVFGPGNINNAHQANEYIMHSDLQKASEKISKIVISYLT
jgi:acetylornithine deacetylase